MNKRDIKKFVTEYIKENGFKETADATSVDIYTKIGGEFFAPPIGDAEDEKLLWDIQGYANLAFLEAHPEKVVTKEKTRAIIECYAKDNDMSVREFIHRNGTNYLTSAVYGTLGGHRTKNGGYSQFNAFVMVHKFVNEVAQEYWKLPMISNEEYESYMEKTFGEDWKESGNFRFAVTHENVRKLIGVIKEEILAKNS